VRVMAPGRPRPGVRRPGPLAPAGALLRRARPRPRVAAIIVAALLAVGGLYLWLRESPLVSVERVTVTGVSGPDAAAIRSALVTAARGMTTLHVDQAQLRAAIAPYPEVKSFRVSAELPHGLLIRVVEQLAVAQVAFEGRTEAVSADGTLLGSQRVAGLPRIALTVAPGGPRVSDPDAVQAIRALAAAPLELFRRIAQMRTEPGHGLVALLRRGPAIYLGDTSRIHAKWLAAAAVLADPGSAGAAYIDVTDPGRPAAGAGTAATAAAGMTSSTGTAGTQASGAVTAANTSTPPAVPAPTSTTPGG
jgi:cell division protein FtsQ